MRELHGLTNEPLYNRWRAMKQRCNDKNHTAYKNYGGRGIRVCKEWSESYLKYREWAYSHGFNEKLTLDRINNNGDYEPSNCRWVSVTIQAYNRRTNRYLTVYGVTHALKEWTDIMGYQNHQVIWQRLQRGWTVEDAVCTPKGKRKSNRWHEEFKQKIKKGVIK